MDNARMTDAKEIRKRDADRRRARLAELLIERFGDSQKAFIDRTGINQGELSALLKEKPFGSTKARLLESQAGVHEGSLEEPPGSPFRDRDSGEHDNSSKSAPNPGVIGGLSAGDGGSLTEGYLLPPTEEEFAFVRQLDITAACGNGRFEDHVVVNGGRAFKYSELREYGVPAHAARIIKSAGGSMWPKIQDGRDVLINTADTEPIDGKIYAICMPHDGLVLKRLVWEYHPQAGMEVWIIRSDNPDKTTFPDKILPPDDRTRIAGRAVWTDSVL